MIRRVYDAHNRHEREWLTDPRRKWRSQEWQLFNPDVSSPDDNGGRCELPDEFADVTQFACIVAGTAQSEDRGAGCNRQHEGRARSQNTERENRSDCDAEPSHACDGGLVNFT